MQPKLILLARHGKAPQKPEGGSYDTLLPEAITALYEGAIKYRGTVRGFSPVTLLWSGRQRTLMTGKTILISAFDMKPVKGNCPPASVDDLVNYDFANFTISEDKRLNYGDNDTNMAVYKRNNSDFTENINFWLQNPDATMHEGVPITSYNKAKAPIVAGVRDHLLLNYRLVLPVTHGSITEPYVIELINAGKKAKITDITEIGGCFGMGDTALIEIGKSQSSLTYKSQKHKLDLAAFMNSE